MQSIHWTPDDRGSSLREMTKTRHRPLYRLLRRTAVLTTTTVTRSGAGPMTASARVFAAVKWIAVMTCLVCGGTAYAQHPQTLRAPKGYSVSEVRGGLYFLTDGAYNTMFLVSDAGVIAVDPLPTLGAKYLQAVADITAKPVTHIVYSHEHLDHIGAAALFPKGAQIIAQRETATLLARRN